LLRLLSLCSSWPARRASAGRPLTTEDTGTLEPRHIEIEVGLDHARSTSTTASAVPSIALNVGVLSRLEATVTGALLVLQPDDQPLRAGPGDSLVKLKCRILDEAASTSALMGAVSARLPSGDQDRGLGAGGRRRSGAVRWQQGVRPDDGHGQRRLHLRTGDRSLDVVNLNAAVETAVAENWLVVGEVVSELSTSREVGHRVVARLGAVYALAEHVSVDAAAAIGLTRATPNVSFTVGITIRVR
jgi:hypothetical protein